MDTLFVYLCVLDLDFHGWLIPETANTLTSKLACYSTPILFTDTWQKKQQSTR